MIELLAVIAIIALLIALLFPALGMIKRKVNAIRCVHNLRQLHMAYTAIIIDNRVAGGENSQRNNRMLGWPVLWLQALQTQRKLFTCPEDKSPTCLVAEAIVDLYSRNSANGWDYNYTRALQEYGGINPSRGNTYTTLWQNAKFTSSSNLVLCDYGSVSNYPMYGSGCAYQDTPGVWVYLTEPFGEAGQFGYLATSNSVTLQGGKQWPSAPTLTDSSYFRHQCAGVIPWTRGYGYRYDLRDGTGKLLATDLTRSNQSVTVPLLPTSYGLNLKAVTLDFYYITCSAAGSRWYWPDKADSLVLLFEYPKPDMIIWDRTCESTCGASCQWWWVDPVMDSWTQWQNAAGEYSFARHNGKLNVLFASGRVEPFKPSEINPGTPANLTNYWFQ